MKYGVRNQFVLLVVLIMTATVLLFEAYVVSHSRFLSNNPFTSPADVFLFLLCPAMPFLILGWLARHQGTRRYPEYRGKCAVITATATFVFSVWVFFNFINNIDWGMDQGTGRVIVLLLPLVTVPGSLILYAVAYMSVVMWRKHQQGRIDAK